MKTMLRRVTEKGVEYDGLWFWCPGCERVDDEGDRHGGLHMLAVNCKLSFKPGWSWNGDLVLPTLEPSILSRRPLPGDKELLCHSYLRRGVFEFLGDCTHEYKGLHVPIPDLPDWVTRE